MLVTRRTLLLSTPILVPTMQAAAQGTTSQGTASQGTASQGTASDDGNAEHGAADAAASRTTAPRDAYVYIGWPQDGQVIYGTRFKVWFGTRNFGVAPAGVSKPNTGHHHLLVDSAMPPLDQPIPNDRNHLHFGLGQTETMLELPPGTHTLQLLMGDADHVPHHPPVVSRRITIQVRAGRPAPVAAVPQ